MASALAPANPGCRPGPTRQADYCGPRLSTHLGTGPLPGPQGTAGPHGRKPWTFPPTGLQAPQCQARPRGPGSHWPRRPGLPARSDIRAPRCRPTLKAPGSRLAKRQAGPGGPSGPSHFAGASKQGSRSGIVLKGLGRSRYHRTGPWHLVGSRGPRMQDRPRHTAQGKSNSDYTNIVIRCWVSHVTVV